MLPELLRGLRKRIVGSKIGGRSLHPPRTSTRPHPGLPEPAHPAYGIGANACFTGGWIVEIIVRKIWREQAGAFGRISFALGFVFSLLLTLAPSILFIGLLILRLLLR
jgi:hypothetical protein